MGRLVDRQMMKLLSWNPQNLTQKLQNSWDLRTSDMSMGDNSSHAPFCGLYTWRPMDLRSTHNLRTSEPQNLRTCLGSFDDDGVRRQVDTCTATRPSELPDWWKDARKCQVKMQEVLTYSIHFIPFLAFKKKQLPSKSIHCHDPRFKGQAPSSSQPPTPSQGGSRD